MTKINPEFDANSNNAYQHWWDEEGSALRPSKEEDIEQFARRLSKIAWSNGAFCAQRFTAWQLTGRPERKPTLRSPRMIGFIPVTKDVETDLVLWLLDNRKVFSPGVIVDCLNLARAGFGSSVRVKREQLNKVFHVEASGMSSRKMTRLFGFNLVDYLPGDKFEPGYLIRRVGPAFCAGEIGEPTLFLLDHQHQISATVIVDCLAIALIGANPNRRVSVKALMRHMLADSPGHLTGKLWNLKRWGLLDIKHGGPGSPGYIINRIGPKA